MKRTLLQDFKQVYKDKDYFYQVTIIKDTLNYKYRILNVTYGSIWNMFFDSYEEAEKFILNHPHNYKHNATVVELGKFY